MLFFFVMKADITIAVLDNFFRLPWEFAQLFWWNNEMKYFRDDENQSNRNDLNDFHISIEFINERLWIEMCLLISPVLYTSILMRDDSMYILDEYDEHFAFINSLILSIEMISIISIISTVNTI